MDYKSLMGYGKNKKVIEEKSKPKKTVLDGIKQELNEWTYNPPIEKRWSKSFGGDGLTEFEQRGGKDFIKEVGASAEYRKYFKDIEKNENKLAKSVNNLKKLLLKKGIRDEALALSSVYMSHIIKFTKHLKKLTNRLM